jgi:hypothetical protein
MFPEWSCAFTSALPPANSIRELSRRRSGSLDAGRRGAVTPVMLRANVSNGSSPAMLGPVRDAAVARRMRIIDGGAAVGKGMD